MSSPKTNRRGLVLGLLAIVAMVIVLLVVAPLWPGRSPVLKHSDGPTLNPTSRASPSSSSVASRQPASPQPTPSQRATVSGRAVSPLTRPQFSPLPSGEPPVYTYRVVRAYEHDPEAFTQGLVFHQGVLYEGTGLRGRSSLRKVELETGRVLQLYKLPDRYFGEGVTVWGKEIFQLTWQSQVGFVYDRESLKILDEFAYPTEGWGITHDGRHLIMSDGSSTLYFLDPGTRTKIGQVQVHDGNNPVVRLNELEFILGEVYANVWQTDRIARIDPRTGQVVGWVVLTGLLKPEDHDRPVDVLNGIAYDAEGDRLFVTGKLWPKLFEIELIPAE